MGEGRKEKRERIAVNKGRLLLLLKIEERSGVGRIYTLHLDDGYTHTIIHSVFVYFSVHTKLTEGSWVQIIHSVYDHLRCGLELS